MATLFADANVRAGLIRELRALGHQVHAPGHHGLGLYRLADDDVLDCAVQLAAAVVTHNARDFIALHAARPDHTGIIVCDVLKDDRALAQLIHAAVLALPNLSGQLIIVSA